MTIDADRAISGIRKIRPHSRIERFRAFLPYEGHLGEPIQISRETMIDDIESGKKVITIFFRNNEWIQGEEVRVTAKRYLRTDHNDCEEDNLGDLPEF